MTDDDHADLLQALLRLDGMVVVSGYETDLYNDTLSGWQTRRTKARISAGRGTAIRTEVLWINPACADALERSRQSLFSELLPS